MVNTARMWQGLSLVLALLVTVSFGRVGSAEVLDTPFGSTNVELDPGFVSALTNLGVLVEQIGPANLSTVTDDTGATTSTVASFPVQTGAANTDPVGLDLLHAGGLKFSVGETSAEISDYVYNTNAADPATGEVLLQGRAVSQSSGDAVTAFTRAPLFNLDLAGITIDQPSDLTDIGVLRATGVVLTLTPEAANFLNSTFGLDESNGLAAGTVIGTADIEVVTTR